MRFELGLEKAMEAYRVGALADLISSSKASQGQDEVKKPLQSLFTSKSPKQTEPVKAAGTENGSAKKKKSKKRTSAEASDEKVVDTSVVDAANAAGASPKKKKKKAAAPVQPVDFSDDDEDAPQYTEPSLRYKVSQTASGRFFLTKKIRHCQDWS